jgi:hypothetical protein
MATITKGRDTNGNSTAVFKAKGARGFSIQLMQNAELSSIAREYNKGEEIINPCFKVALCEFVIKHGTTKQQSFVREFFAWTLWNQ